MRLSYEGEEIVVGSITRDESLVHASNRRAPKNAAAANVRACFIGLPSLCCQAGTVNFEKGITICVIYFEASALPVSTIECLSFYSS